VNLFAGYLEAPESVTSLWRKHGAASTELHEAREVLFGNLLRDAIERRFPRLETDATVPWARLQRRGLSPTPDAAPAMADGEFDDW
jgi:hypothetical protein